MQLFVNDLTVIDFSYLHEQRGIVGESWIVDVLLDGSLNEQSMVLDFGIVKKQIKAIIDDAVDHKLLLPMMNTQQLTISNSERAGHEFVDFTCERANYFLQSPNCAFAKIPAETITLEAVTEYLVHIIKAQLPQNVAGLTLTLRPEQIDGFYYHYTHGLKKHDGNCQRIAHGHRSKIQLYKNNIRSIKLEKEWCQRWQDIYIASNCDRVNKADIELSAHANTLIEKIDLPTEANEQSTYQYFSYYAPQGRFDIAVSDNVLDEVDCDSTVELLADYIARQLKAEHSDDEIKVIAYEGVAKGAIASA